MTDEISTTTIDQQIYLVRGHRVMLDSTLAEMYGTDTRALNRAVTRNLDRFPETFMFRLTQSEHENLMYQIGTSSLGKHGGRRKLPLVFTEYGVVMLSSVLNSSRAVQVSIAVVRAFIRLRELMDSHQDLAVKIDQLERTFMRHDHQFKVVFEAIRRLLATRPPAHRRRIKGLGGQ